MSLLHRVFALSLVAGLVTASAPDLGAQSIKDRLKQKAKERIDQKTDKAADKALDKAEQTVTCAASDTECAEKAKAEGKTVVTDSSAGSSSTASDAPTAPPKAFVNFDFVPGERVLFADDFAKDNVGDFPKRFHFIKGNMEVAEFLGSRWLRGTTDGLFAIELKEKLPDRFTMEFDHYGLASSYPQVMIFFGDDMDAEGRDNQKLDRVVVKTWHGNSETSGGGVLDKSGGVRAVGNMSGGHAQNRVVPVRVMADGKYVKVYMGGTRVANVPNADIGRAQRIVFYFDASDDAPAYFGNFRVAAGGKDLYDALAAEGRVATQGIYFDTGSDKIRPESAPTLKQIGTMLKEHADLSLTIEGHTDNVGSAAANQALSEKRAAAVRAALIAEYGISETRLESKGLGASKPATSNDTPEGRQMNRRVELVKK